MDLELTVVQRAKPDLGYIAGLAVGDEMIVAAGGTSRHAPTMLASSDARHFELRPTPRQLGLRDVLVAGDSIWTCGEYGQLARSRDRGTTWRVIDTGVDICVFGLALAADGSVWACGDAGYVARIHEERLERIDFNTTTRLTAIYCMRDETIALGLDGVMYRWRGGEISRVATGAPTQLNAFVITNKGSWLVIGDGGFIARSPDGAWFSRVRTTFEPDFEAIASLADGRIVMVGDRGTIVVSTDDGRTWTRVESEVTTHLWMVRRFGQGALIGGDEGLILKLAPAGDSTWQDRVNVFGGAKPLDGVFALGPEGFVARGVPAYIALAGCDGAKKTVEPSADVFARIYGAPLPPEVDALFAAARGRDCFEELQLDATLISEVADENLFERVLARGATDAFCGVFCIGARTSGDTYHMEIYEWDGPRQVLHFDHKTQTFTGVIADSLDSLVYQAALARAAKRRQISDEAHALAERQLHGKVAPAIDAKRRDAEFFFSRSRWICALLDGNVDVAEIPSLFMPDFNQIVPPEQLEARFEACETIIPTALYSMWRAYFFDEVELTRYLEIGARHKARLVRDAATLIEELRDGRNTLGSITNMRARLAAFRALALDPRTSALDIAWQSLDNAAAQRALVARFSAMSPLSAQIDKLEELRTMSASDRAAAIETLARDLAPELEAILAGAVVRGDHVRPARPPTAPPSPAEEITALVQMKSPNDRVTAALAMTRRALALDPGDDTTEFTHSMLLLEAGLLEELAQRWPSLSSQNQEALVDKVAPALDDACVKAHAEQAYDVAVRLALAAQPFAAAYPSLHHSAACAFAAVGDYARAFEQVKLAIEHDAEHVADMEVDSHLGPLLDWPEFKALFRDWHARKEGN